MLGKDVFLDATSEHFLWLLFSSLISIREFQPYFTCVDMVFNFLSPPPSEEATDVEHHQFLCRCRM